jgi:hypothetical protein
MYITNESGYINLHLQYQDEEAHGNLTVKQMD